MIQFYDNQKAAERGGYGDERYEQLEFQKKVAGSYLSLRDSSWKVTCSPFVDGNRNVCLSKYSNQSDNLLVVEYCHLVFDSAVLSELVGMFLIFNQHVYGD